MSIEGNYTPFYKGPVSGAFDFSFRFICIYPVFFGKKEIIE
jgi:hypothetical protein